MNAYCANEYCQSRLHSFSDGRLFQFEVVSVSMSAADIVTGCGDAAEGRKSAQFWVCGSCAGSMTLVLEPSAGLKLIPIGGEPPEQARLSQREILANNC